MNDYQDSVVDMFYREEFQQSQDSEYRYQQEVSTRYE